ncbi:MAG: hypothetical protein ACKOW9_03440 [Candidatus Paceibacterota bacterium]
MQWVENPNVVHELNEGEQSYIFKIKGESSYGESEIYSCYLRLHSNRSEGLTYGIVRLEAFDSELLAPLAAFCLQDRQTRFEGDLRHDTHLRSMRQCEMLLKTLKPEAFNL